MLGVAGKGLLGAVTLVGAGWWVSRRVIGTHAEEAVPLARVASPGWSLDLEKAVKETSCLLERTMTETGAPGLVMAVSVDGKMVHSQGVGLSDVENNVPCHPDTVMRIASISKAITMATVARAWESGLLDLDSPVQTYVPQFPCKTFQGEQVTITTRQLVSHLSGIRHYEKKYMEKETKGKTTESKDGSTAPKEDEEDQGEFATPEYHIMTPYKSVSESLKLFQDDPLVHKPGKYLYTTHGWTLVSAVLEGVYKKPFPDILQKCLQELGMTKTCLDQWGPIIPHRARYYRRLKSGVLANAPYVDCSYKWAGGGLLSTEGDLVTFGNAMLYSAQCSASAQPALPCSFSESSWSGLPCKHSPQPLVLREKSPDSAMDVGRVLSSFEMEERNVDGFVALWEEKSHVEQPELGGRFFEPFLPFGVEILQSDGDLLCTNKYVVTGGELDVASSQGNTSFEPGSSHPLILVSDSLCHTQELNRLASEETPNKKAFTLAQPGQDTQVSEPLPGYLKQETVEKMWQPVTATKEKDPTSWYGLGWALVPQQESYGGAEARRQHVWHSGGAIGASSILLILPRQLGASSGIGVPPRGVVVAMFMNLTGVSLKKQALEIAMIFDKLPTSESCSPVPCSDPSEGLKSC